MAAPCAPSMDKVPAVVKALIEDNSMGLPRLPIPALEDTLAKYLAGVKPLCTDEEFAAQEKLVEEFKTGPGPKLHAAVTAKDAHDGYPYSFIERAWDEMYYGLRCTAPVNISPFFAITDEKDASKMVQTTRAATFISGFTRWSRKMLAGNMEPDKDMCSHAYPKHFSSAKIPKKGMDELAMYPESRHITVLCNGQLFTVEIVSAEGSILDVAGIAAKLDEVKAAAAAAGPGTLALLTAEDRDVWADARAALEAEAGNAEKLQALDAGIIAVCLDEAPKAAGDLKERSERLLVGPGANRWWDKQQLVVDGSGFMGIAFEHSYGDGTNWGRFIREVMDDAAGKAAEVPLAAMATHEAAAAPAPVHVQLTVPAAVAATVEKAAANYAKLQADIDIEVVDFRDFGKAEVKTWNCSPDAVCQLAFMAAYYQLHGAMPPVYEACATRKFFHGRTETIRSCTQEAFAFCKALASGAPKEETLGLMQAAAKQHSAVSKAAAGGAGIDRILTAMSNISEESVALFDDAMFKKSKTWGLSTSNGSGPYLALFGFAAVSATGYGLGYLVENNSMSVVASCYHSCADTSASKMAAKIAETFNMMKALI